MSEIFTQNEKILCSALDYNGIIICGHRHSDCYNILNGILSKHNVEDELPERTSQGFLTSFNRFVDRREAWIIAEKNNQIEFGKSVSDLEKKSILISENLY